MYKMVEQYQIGKTKDDFKCFLNEEIKKQFSEISIDTLDYEEARENICKTLLMFNLQTFINSKDSNMKFQFDRYKEEKWDIEHIRPQTDKYPEKNEDKEKWFKDIQWLIKSKHSANSNEDENPSDPNINEPPKDTDEFRNYYDKMQTKYEGKDFNKNKIGNLTLLDAGTNRGYGNAFFPIKRKIIRNKDMKGVFIPICTKNVFMKYYTDDITQSSTWSETDAKAYEDKIKQTLQCYLKREKTK